MDKVRIRDELQRITEELKELQELVEADCRKDKDRYNVGVLVGIGYVQRELEKIINGHNKIEGVY